MAKKGFFETRLLRSRIKSPGVKLLEVGLGYFIGPFGAMLAGGIVILSEVLLRASFFRSNRRSSRDRDAGQLQLVLIVVGIVLAILAPLLTTLIQLAMSRQREYLADASAVEFTRNPEGLAGALAKLAGDRTPMECSKATESMFIVSPKVGLRGGADDLFSTHPPIRERINRLMALR